MVVSEQARSRGLNVSALTRAAIAEELERTSVPSWVDSLPTMSRAVDHDAPIVWWMRRCWSSPSNSARR